MSARVYPGDAPHHEKRGVGENDWNGDEHRVGDRSEHRSDNDHREHGERAKWAVAEEPIDQAVGATLRCAGPLGARRMHNSVGKNGAVGVSATSPLI